MYREEIGAGETPKMKRRRNRDKETATRWFTSGIIDQVTWRRVLRKLDLAEPRKATNT